MKNVLTCCLTLFPACLLTRALTYILTEAVTYSSLTYVPTNVVTYFLMCYLMLFGNLDVAFSMAAVNIRCAGIFSFGSIGFGSGTREAVYGINCGVVFAVHERGFASVLDSRTPVSVFRSCLLECAALESCEVGHPTLPRSLVFLVFQSDPATTKASDSSDDLGYLYL
jgi:hypothetical protein